MKFFLLNAEGRTIGRWDDEDSVSSTGFGFFFTIMNTDSLHTDVELYEAYLKWEARIAYYDSDKVPYDSDDNPMDDSESPFDDGYFFTELSEMKSELAKFPLQFRVSHV